VLCQIPARPCAERGSGADDEVGGYDGLVDRLPAQALVKRAGQGDALAEDRADRAGVTSFDRDDRGSSQEIRRGLDVPGLPEVGTDTGVLQDVRRGGELGRVAGDAVEVELRLPWGRALMD
jgi:hypothetical protein